MKTRQSYTSPSQLPLTLTVEETACILNISRNSAYRLVSSGELPSFRVGHKLRIFKVALLSFMNNQSVDLA